MALAEPRALRLSGIRSQASPSYEGGGELKGLDPANLREAYKLPESGGSGQTVAIVDAYNDPKAESDLKVYREKYGLGSCTRANSCFEKVNQKGESSENEESSIYPKAEREWDVEISLDLDMVSAVCKECHIILVEANESTFEDLDKAEVEASALKGITEISNSWGGPERPEETSENAYFYHPGIPTTVSAGDHGYHKCERYEEKPTICYPAAAPGVISVGGTTLSKAENARGWQETVWGGTGSGCSEYEEKPSWQTDKGCSNRTDNEVAADASGSSPVSVYDSYEAPGWELVWGTSAASPIVSGIEAHASSATRLLAADAFYKKPTMLFHVSEGNNGECAEEPSEPLYYLCHGTKEGYNGPTGEGTPDGVFASFGSAAATEAAMHLTPNEAGLHGLVNPNGMATKYYFQYGTTQSLGSSTEEVSVGSGTVNLEESKTVTGLTPGTKYYFRVVAKDALFERTYGLIQTFTTTSWAIQETPNPKELTGNGANLKGVSCISANACIAVGNFENTANHVLPLAETWNGTTWTLQEPPSPKEASASHLHRVSCTSSTACTAVGSYQTTSGSQALAERWNGSTWSIQELPTPKEANGKETILYDVSCTSSEACVAVGRYANKAGATTMLVERWNGKEWSLQEPPSPTGAKGSNLQGVSCTASTACVAMGDFTNSSAKLVPLAERWNGAEWSAQEPPNPTGAKTSWLNNVSCGTSTSCSSVGYYTNSAEEELLFAESWNGTTWSVQEVPKPKNAVNKKYIYISPYDVSCTSSGECVAVGEFNNSSEKWVPFAELWNGVSWSAQEPPIPTGGTYVGMTGVSCVGSLTCVGVGGYYPSSGWGDTLAELYS